MRLRPECDGGFTLRSKTTYVFKIEQQLGPQIKKEEFIHGQATARSSVGRIDVLARLIVDGMSCYEGFNHEGIHQASGCMYLEITPITFHVKVKPGISLSQLRLFWGAPDDCEIKGQALYESVLLSDSHNLDGSLSVDLSSTSVWDSEACAFRAIFSPKSAPICLWKKPRSEMPDPNDYWGLEVAKNVGGLKLLRIKKESFYILRSKEQIALPGSIAVYCRAIDETIGEMRIHYAGFAHPLFGRDRSDEKVGTPLIFEVRGHDVKVSLTDGEKMARLTFYRMSEIGDEGKKVRKRKMTAKRSDYEDPILRLSSFFRPFSPAKRQTRNS